MTKRKTHRKNSVFFGPFAKHLRPRKVRLIVAIVCMLGLSICSTYNILLAKPALDVLFSKVDHHLEREEAQNAKIVRQRQKLAEAAASTKMTDRIATWWKTRYRPIQQEVENLIYENSFFDSDDFVSPRLLVRELREPSQPLTAALHDLLSTSTLAVLETEATSEGTVPSQEVLARVADNLNDILTGPNLVPILAPRASKRAEAAPTSTTLEMASVALRDLFSTSTVALLQTATSSQAAAPVTGVLTRIAGDLDDIRQAEPDLVPVLAPISTVREDLGITSTTLRQANAAFTFMDDKHEGERIHVNRAVLDQVYPQVLATKRPMPLYQYAEKYPTRCLRWVACFIAFVALLSGLFEFGFNYNLSYAIYGAIIALKSEIFRHVMDQDMRFFNERSVGFLMNRVTGDVQAVGQVFDIVIKDAMLQSIRMVFLFSILIWLEWHLTAMLLLFIGPTFGILAFFARSLRKVARKQKKRQDVLSAAMNESLGNVRLVKAMATEDLECERFDEHNTKLFYYEMNRRLAKFAASPIMECLGTFAVAAILIVASWAIFSEKLLSSSNFMIYAVTLMLFYKPIKSLSKMNVNWQNGVISAERMSELLSLHPTVADPPDGVTPVVLDAVSEGIAVRDVTFAYDQKVVLDHVTMEFQAGTTTAIVGRSGSGKTTLANLLLRLYDPDSGCIEIDGHDVRDFRLRELRSHFGIVTQETHLFDDTVAGNIAYGTREGRTATGGRGEVDMNLVVAASKAANAHEFIMALDGGLGYLSPVGPRGGSLSGGQRQRLAIARAFYRDPQILLLDEATSALDTKSEAAVQKALYSLMENRTVIVIAHRLSTIMHAHNIIVLHDGQVVEQGTHSELIALGGQYAMLYNLGEFSKKDEPVEVSTEFQPD